MTPEDFELTRADFFDLFTFGYEFHLSTAPEDEVYAFDAGFTDDPDRKEWAVPDADFVTVVWTIVDPATTPYQALFPGATHTLMTSSETDYDGTQYYYYRFEEERFVFAGYIEDPADGSGRVEERVESQMGSFPLNGDIDFMRRGFTYIEDEDGIDPEQPFPVVSHLGAHGFGTIQRPDGTAVEAGAFFDDYVIFEADGSEDVFDFDTFYSMVGVDGTWLSFRIADPPGHEDGDEIPIEGEVWIDELEYVRIVPPAATAGEQGPDGGASWSLYPNPATDRVLFSEPLTATVFDMMGRAVREANRAREVDLRGLAPGTYVVRSEAGRSRTVTVRR